MNKTQTNLMDWVNTLDLPTEEKIYRIYKYYDWPLSYDETKQYLINNMQAKCYTQLQTKPKTK